MNRMNPFKTKQSMVEAEHRSGASVERRVMDGLGMATKERQEHKKKWGFITTKYANHTNKKKTLSPFAYFVVNNSAAFADASLYNLRRFVSSQNCQNGLNYLDVRSGERTCFKTHIQRRVGARGLQEMARISIPCRPGPLTGRVLKQALSAMAVKML